LSLFKIVWSLFGLTLLQAKRYWSTFVLTKQRKYSKMKTIKILLTLILVGTSALLFAGTADPKPSAVAISAPEFVWGDAKDASAAFMIAMPEFNWGDPLDVEAAGRIPASSAITMPGFVWGDPADAGLAAPVSFPEFSWGDAQAVAIN
jgi:hypothetical protein